MCQLIKFIIPANQISQVLSRDVILFGVILRKRKSRKLWKSKSLYLVVKNDEKRICNQHLFSQNKHGHCLPNMFDSIHLEM